LPGVKGAECSVHKQAEGMAPVRRKGGGGGEAEAGASKKSSGSGRSFWGKAGFEGEVAENLIDIVCTWGMLTGMAGSAVWSNWAIPSAGSHPSSHPTLLPNGLYTTLPHTPAACSCDPPPYFSAKLPSQTTQWRLTNCRLNPQILARA